MSDGKKKRITAEAQRRREAEDAKRQNRKAKVRRTIDHTVALRRGTVNLAAATTPDLKSQITNNIVRLEAKLASGEFSVDRAGAGALRNVSIISAGPAIGHGFIVDDVMLQQTADAINAAGGVKVRLTHPWLEDGVLYRLGRAVKGARVETTANGNKVRGDIVFGKYAAKSPKGGDLAGYVMDLADEDPAELGVSISFEPDEYEERLDPATGEPIAPAGRIKKLLAVDVVDDPAANPDGLLSEKRNQEPGTRNPEPGTRNPEPGTRNPGAPGTQNEQPGREHGRSGITNEQGESDMKLNTRQRAYLTSCGLATDAADEQIKTFITELKAGQVKYLTSLQSADEDKTPATPAEPAKGDTAGSPNSPQADADKAAEKALSGDRQRRKDILSLAAAEGATVSLDAARQWADDGVSLADARRLAELARTLTPIPTGRVEGGTDRNLATIADGISDALLLRAGAQLMTFDRYTGQADRDEAGRIIPRKAGERAQAMRRLSVPELGKHYLAAVGVSGNNLSAMSGGQVLELASCRRDQFGQRLREAGGSVDLAMSTSDFPYILADAMGKVFLGGYNLAPSTGQLWTRRMTARDFKDVKLLNLSDAPALQSRAEGQGISFGTMSESREVVALAEYSSGLIWTRRAQINDDLGVLRDGGAMALGAMARYKEDDVVYAILTANAALADGIALFYATHGNISSGASTAVYAAAAPGVHPTIVQLFLESEQAPVMKQEVQWDTDDLKVAVRHSVAAKAADYRGLYKDITGNATVASLALIVQAMAIQTAPGGAFLNLRPTFILCPAGVSQVTWSQLVGCSVDPAKNNATNNPFFNQLTVIGEPRLN